MPINNPTISVFIPTYNDQTDLAACLQSINDLDYPKGKIEIVIWDNGSEDETPRMVRERFDQMKNDGWLNLSLTEWSRNEGSYVPYNMALPNLSSETQYIFGLDADVELDSDVLKNLVDAAVDHQTAVVGARSVYFDNPEITSHGAGFVNSWTARFTENDAKGQIECDYVIGCCWLFNRAVFQELGCFDPEYYINHWEVDYCLRAKNNGFRIIYEPKAIAKHKIPLEGTLSPERIYYLYRNKLLLIRKIPTFFKNPSTFLFCFGLSLGRILSSFARPGKMPELKDALEGLRDGLLDKRGKKENLL
jgi:GT2 family glycosyltransferase